MNTIRKILLSVIPTALRRRLALAAGRKKWELRLANLHRDILAAYENNPSNTDEENEVVSFLKDHPVHIFPYSFTEDYPLDAIEVKVDEKKALPYVLHEGKRLYFKKSMSHQSIRKNYQGLLFDQDLKSPHRYTVPGFEVKASDVIADIGAAEGNFSLTNVETAKKIYLFEYDPEWIEALEATFAPWKDKVTVFPMFVTAEDGVDRISIDSFAKQHPDISFFKVDIEGEERNFLDGATNYLKNTPDVRMVLCTYHKENDHKEFSALLASMDFKIKTSNRFMIYYYDLALRAPFLRRALIRAEKNG